MGQKTHPKGFRLVTTQKHLSEWYSDKLNYSGLMEELVPPMAALAGVFVLSEAVSLRLALASAAILGGVALVLVSRSTSAALKIQSRLPPETST